MSHPLLAGLASADRDDRLRACRNSAGDPSALFLVEALVERLGDADERVAWAASDALVRIGARDGSVDPLLRRAQHSERPRVRLFASFARAGLGKRDVGLLPALIGAWEAGSGPAYWRAGQIVVGLAAVLPEVRPLLCELAEHDPRSGVRQMAAHCLRRLGAAVPTPDQNSR